MVFPLPHPPLCLFVLFVCFVWSTNPSPFQHSMQLVLVLLLSCYMLVGVRATLDLSNYTLTWDQDFTQMTTLGVSDWGPVNATQRKYSYYHYVDHS